MRAVLALALLVGTASACAMAPARDNLVVSNESPALTLRIADGFVEVPPLRFPIENLTDVERRIFVEPDADRRIRRQVIVQFERVQAGSDFRFVYPSTPPRRFGTQVYRAGAFLFDEVHGAEAEPLREAGRTRAWLAERGYVQPRLWRVGRLARVTDPAGLSEVIIFYREAADADFAATPPALDANGGMVLDEAEAAALFSRMEAAITPVRG